MKKILLFVLFILVIFSGHFFYQNKFQSTNKSAIQQKNIVVYLKITAKKDFTRQNVSLNKTALEFTKNIAKVITKGEGVNAYVIEINGRLADETKKEFWAFYINGKTAEVGAGSYKLKDGDKIEWKLETY